MHPAYSSKHKTVKICYSFNDSKWRRRYIDVILRLKPALLREIALKDNSEFYCLNSFHSFRRKNKLELQKKSM